MRLRLRLVLYIAAAALFPLTVLGLASLHIASRLLLSQVADLQARTAASVAGQVDMWVALQKGVLAQQVRTFALGQLSETATTQYLRLVYRQTPGARVVGLFDVDGRPLVGEVFLSTPVGAADPDLADRPLASADSLPRFYEALPAATNGQVELSAPYGDQPLVAAAVPIPGGDLVLGVELSLAALTAIFEVGPGGDLALLDAGGSIVMGGQSGIIRPEAFRAFRGGALAEDIRYTDPDGIDVVAACAPLPSVGWTVVVAEPVASALAPIRQIQQRLGYMLLVAGALSLGLGVIFADQLSLPVVRLREAARRMAQGELGATVPATGRDEVAELTVAFNEMSLRLRQDADEIARKNSEIEGFNRDLQRRVDEATADLRAAQARLLRAARLEAAGELGAGLAHELNNPLASVLGGAQLLRARATEPSTRAMLDAVEREALRCRQIVAQLTALREPAGRTAPSPAVSLPDLAHHVTALVRGSFQERGIALVVDVDAEGPGVVDAAAGAQALTALLACARAAGGAGATVTLRRLAGEPILDLCQSGPVGDADDARAQGLAAWAASQLFATVGATVEAEAQDPAGGRRWRVRFAA